MASHLDSPRGDFQVWSSATRGNCAPPELARELFASPHLTLRLGRLSPEKRARLPIEEPVKRPLEASTIRLVRSEADRANVRLFRCPEEDRLIPLPFISAEDPRLGAPYPKRPTMLLAFRPAPSPDEPPGGPPLIFLARPRVRFFHWAFPADEWAPDSGDPEERHVPGYAWFAPHRDPFGPIALRHKPYAGKYSRPRGLLLPTRLPEEEAPGWLISAEL